jgi:uncharacterized protein (TIGR02722 family)
MKRVVFFAAAAALAFASCSSRPQVTRLDAETQIDLSGYWNDSDVRIVCKDLVEQCIDSPKVSRTTERMNRTPKVMVGKFTNTSTEHIDTSIIKEKMETEILNSGVLDFVADVNTRQELRAERKDQDNQGSREASGADLLGEAAADFMLTGSVKTMVDKADNKTLRTYVVSAQLTNISTNELMWKGQNDKIKKVIVQPKHKL